LKKTVIYSQWRCFMDWWVNFPLFGSISCNSLTFCTG
jgi:hypothetical protein